MSRKKFDTAMNVIVALTVVLWIVAVVTAPFFGGFGHFLTAAFGGAITCACVAMLGAAAGSIFCDY